MALKMAGSEEGNGDGNNDVRQGTASATMRAMAAAKGGG
jgi:hypothetical protein